MNTDKLDQMAQVAEALYLEEFRKIREILAREAALRASLTRLKERRAQSTSQEMQAIGADILWKGWMDKTGRQLNTELAQVMAHKLSVMSAVERSFGRKEAVRKLAQKAAADRKLRRDRAKF